MTKIIKRRTFLRSLAAGALLAGGGPLLYAALVEPLMVEIVEQEIPLPGLGKGLHGLRVAQISDLHMGMWTSREQLIHVLELLLEQRPDLILITGDYLTNGGDLPTALKDLSAALALFAGQAPVMTIRGNHDHGDGEEDLSAIFQTHGIIELANTIQPFQRAGDVLYIAGVDSISTGHQHLEWLDRDAPTDAPVILMAHEPDMAQYSAPTGKFDLQISGHSHGGQVILPLIGSPFLPWMGKKYPAGLYQLPGMLQYTNRGIGMVRVPFRLNCPPEITIFTLVPAGLS